MQWGARNVPLCLFFELWLNKSIQRKVYHFSHSQCTVQWHLAYSHACETVPISVFGTLHLVKLKFVLIRQELLSPPPLVLAPSFALLPLRTSRQWDHTEFVFL